MNFNMQLNVGALFKLQAHKGDGVPTRQTDWFTNLVLNSGLDRLSQGNAFDRVYVGTGNSTPNFNQTSLDAVIAHSTWLTGIVTGRNTSSDPVYYYFRRTYRFGEGAASGNLSEVGAGWDNGLFNRSLIKDINGNPTTITVLADEFLDVIVEMRVYPARTFSGSFNLKNKLGDIVSTHTYDGVCFLGENPYTSADLGRVFLGSPGVSERFGRVYSGSANLDSITAEPSGGIVVIPSGDSTYPTLRSCKTDLIFNLNDGNTFAHKSFSIGVSYLCSWQAEATVGYKWEIDPPITKTNLQALRYSVLLSWDRYTP